MAPIPQRRIVPRDRFGALFAALKTQAYHEPPSRQPGRPDVRTLAWNPTGTYIATGLGNSTIRVWNPDRPSYKHSTELKGHTGSIEKVAFNPTKEAELASCAKDSTVRFWDVRAKLCVAKVDVGTEVITVTWSNDGTILLAGTKASSSTAVVPSWSLTSWKNDILIPISMTTETPTILSRHPQTAQTNITTFSNTPEPVDLLITQGDGSVRILDFPSFSVLHTLHAHTSACSALALSPTGRYLAIGGSDALVSLWDTTNWICQRTIPITASGKVVGISWSFDGRYLCVAMDDVSSSSGSGSGGGLEIYHAETGDVVHTVTTASADTPAVAWHPNRYWLAYSHVERSEAGIMKGYATLRIIGAAGGPTM